MASVIDGGLLAADMLKLVDSGGARALNTIYSTFGVDVPGEGTTAATKYTTGRKSICGDGTTTYPGIANAQFKQLISVSMQRAVPFSHYDGWTQILETDFWNRIDDWVRQSLPSGWSFVGSNMRMTDMHLSRMNANHSSAPATPATAATLVATTGGSRPTVAVGSAMRLKWSLVKDSDWKESLPSPASAQVALSGANSAFQVDLSGVAGSIPAGVTKIRLYGQYDGSAVGDPYYFIKDITVTAGTAYSTLTAASKWAVITEPDYKFLKSWQPPSYMSVSVLPEGAYCYAISQASAPATVGDPFVFTSSCQLSPTNVALNPINGFLGQGNNTQHGTFATWTSAVSTYGTIQIANVNGSNIQGFAGATNSIRARVTSALDFNASISSVSYTYCDSSNPYTPTTGTLTGPFTLNLGLGQTVDLAVPAGQIVRSVTAMTVTTATTGTFVVEATPVRTI